MNYEESFFREILDFFRLGLNLSVVSKQEITEWADGHLLNDTLLSQNDILVEFSLSKKWSTKELSMFIGQVIGVESTVLGSRLLLGKLCQLNNFGKTIRKLTQFIELMRLDEVEENLVENIDFCFNYNNQFSAVGQKFIEQTKNRAITFLDFYQEYKIENLSQIEKIEEKLFNELFIFGDL